MNLRNTFIIALAAGLLAAGLAWYKKQQREKVARYKSGHVMIAGNMSGSGATSLANLDTLNPKKKLYGLGFTDASAGEIMILDGTPFISQVNKAGEEDIRTDWKVSAPFFVSARVADWQTVDLQELSQSPMDLKSLEKMLPEFAGRLGIDTSRPFPFLLKSKKGIIEYHIGQLPDSAPSKPFQLKDVESMMLGFHSRGHQAAITQGGTTTHIHVLSSDRKHMGHVDGFSIPIEKMQLMLPKAR